jgi:hypothetical protein
MRVTDEIIVEKGNGSASSGSEGGHEPTVGGPAAGGEATTVTIENDRRIALEPRRSDKAKGQSSTILRDNMMGRYVDACSRVTVRLQGFQGGLRLGGRKIVDRWLAGRGAGIEKVLDGGIKHCVRARRAYQTPGIRSYFGIGWR